MPAVTGVWMAGVIVAAFLWLPPAMGLGETSRIAWFHIPAAWISILAFGTAMVGSIGYLIGRDLRWDDRASAAAEIGLLFTVLATVSGALWAQRAWGTYWNWDPRQTSIVILMLIYGAYFALRGAIEDPQRRGVLAAVYNVVAFVTVPYLVFIVPRVMASLHPDPLLNTSGQGGMAPEMRLVLTGSVIGMTLLFAWLHTLAGRLRRYAREMFDE